MTLPKSEPPPSPSPVSSPASPRPGRADRGRTERAKALGIEGAGNQIIDLVLEGGPMFRARLLLILERLAAAKKQEGFEEGVEHTKENWVPAMGTRE